jgi:hypothetical protein
VEDRLESEVGVERVEDIESGTQLEEAQLEEAQFEEAHHKEDVDDSELENEDIVDYNTPEISKISSRALSSRLAGKI